MTGRIMDALKANGLEDNTVVIFGSDHGELLGDHGMLHKGGYFYEGSIRVPFIFRFPPRLGVTGVDRGFASHVDLAPTLAALAGVPGPQLVQGAPLFGYPAPAVDDMVAEDTPHLVRTVRNLDDGVVHRPVPARDAALTEWREKPLNSDEPFHVARCLTTERWKYVEHHQRDYGELYDLENDPHELRNLWADAGQRGTVAEMRERLRQFQVENEPCPERTDIF
jgi:arylsulfatase A-like enzyme